MSAEQLAHLFGRDRLFRCDQASLPEVLEHFDTRRWLGERGLPAVDFMTLDTRDLPAHGLVPAADAVSETGTPPSGFFLHLGTLLGEELMVNGSSGRVLCVSEDASARYAGSSLGQFVTMFWLMARHHLVVSESLTIDTLEARTELEASSWGVTPLTGLCLTFGGDGES